MRWRRWQAGAVARGGLHALERKEFVRRERASTVEGDREYAFRHLLVRDVAYGQIPRADRAEKHLLAARWIEQLGRREDHAEMLAHHYLQALELTEAAGGSTDAFAGRGGRGARRCRRSRVALNAYDAAVALLPGCARSASPESDPGRARCSTGSAASLYELGETDPAMLEQARDELLAAGDVEGAAEAETHTLRAVLARRGADAAMEHLAGEAAVSPTASRLRRRRA